MSSPNSPEEFLENFFKAVGCLLFFAGFMFAVMLAVVIMVGRWIFQ